MKDYYVYEYWRLDNNTCFYVGKGKNNRCFDINDRSNFFKRIVNKVECVVIIVDNNLTEKEAHATECMLIHKYIFEEGYGITMHHNCKKGTPYLVNSTWGGEGCSGRILSQETKRKIGFKNSGRKHTYEENENNRIKHIGKRHTQEAKEKIGKSSIGRNSGKSNWKAKKVICVNTGEIFNTIKDASRKFNCWDTNIIACCKGKHKYVGNHLYFMYYEDYINKSLEEKEKLFKMSQKEKGHQSHKIVCVELNKTFNSIEEAKNYFNLKSGSGIGECCKGKRKTSGGYHWIYYSEYLKQA